jgi:hypothetical protein
VELGSTHDDIGNLHRSLKYCKGVLAVVDIHGTTPMLQTLCYLILRVCATIRDILSAWTHHKDLLSQVRRTYRCDKPRFPGVVVVILQVYSWHGVDRVIFTETFGVDCDASSFAVKHRSLSDQEQLQEAKLAEELAFVLHNVDITAFFYNAPSPSDNAWLLPDFCADPTPCACLQSIVMDSRLRPTNSWSLRRSANMSR